MNFKNINFDNLNKEIEFGEMEIGDGFSLNDEFYIKINDEFAFNVTRKYSKYFDEGYILVKKCYGIVTDVKY